MSNQPERDLIVSVMANAIAYELEGPGVTSIEQMERYRRAADRALRQGIEAKADDRRSSTE